VVKPARRRAFLGTLASTGGIAAEAIAENPPDRTTPVDPVRQANCTHPAALTQAACELSKTKTLGHGDTEAGLRYSQGPIVRGLACSG
jgi:hypothetical protein